MRALGAQRRLSPFVVGAQHAVPGKHPWRAAAYPPRLLAGPSGRYVFSSAFSGFSLRSLRALR